MLYPNLAKISGEVKLYGNNIEAAGAAYQELAEEEGRVCSTFESFFADSDLELNN
jgi:hypothetical protein